MFLKPLMTHEIGSLAKPNWRVKAMNGTAINDQDVLQAEEWGRKLHIPHAKILLDILAKRQGFTEKDRESVLYFSSLYGIKFFESAGIDLVWDGEQHRVEMYEYPIRRIGGFQFHGHVRSFDNKYYRKASCEERPSFKEAYHLQEFKLLQQLAVKEIKIPVTGAYTLADWSYDAYYFQKVAPGVEHLNEKRFKARSEFLSDLSTQVVYPNLKALYEAGARYLQIDEPAAMAKRGETSLFIQSMKESIGDLAQKLFFSVHICYSAYSRLFPEIQELEGILDAIHLEYANRDSRNLGRSEKERTGYAILSDLKKTKFIVGLGVLDIHSDFIEPPSLVRDRILYACDVIQDPCRIMVAPDCGLRTRNWDIAYKKLQNMVEGKNLALQELCRT